VPWKDFLMTRDRGLYRVQPQLTIPIFSYTFSRLFIQDLFRVGHRLIVLRYSIDGATVVPSRAPPHL
jgi:hypothetical protein